MPEWVLCLQLPPPFVQRHESLINGHFYIVRWAKGEFDELVILNEWLERFFNNIFLKAQD